MGGLNCVRPEAAGGEGALDEDLPSVILLAVPQRAVLVFEED